MKFTKQQVIRAANIVAADRRKARGDELKRLWRAEQLLRQVARMKARLEEESKVGGTRRGEPV